MAADTQRPPAAAQHPRAIGSGSHTETVAGPSTASLALNENQGNSLPPAAILRLRGAQRNDRNVQWAENVVDNEGLNRKKSKVCCIYHRPRGVDESSDDSSSSSDSQSGSSSDSDSDGGQAARSDADHAFRNNLGNTGGNSAHASSRRHAPDCPEHGQDHGHVHDHGHGHSHSHDSSEDEDADDEGSGCNDGRDRKGKAKAKEKAKEKARGKRKPSPNAYEKMPRYSKPDKTPTL